MSRWYQIKMAVVAAGKALNLAGTGSFGAAADSIGEKWFSYLFTRTEIVPCVVATCEGQVPRPIGGDNTQVEWEFPVLLWICDATSPNDDAREELYQDWHETIRRAFNQKALGDLAHDCTVDSTPMFDPEIPRFQHVRMGMLLKFKAYEDR